MKLQIRFALALVVSTCLVLGLALVSSHGHVKEMARLQAFETCNMILSQVEASRSYVRDELRPAFFKHVEKGEFVPEGMSASFVARNQFERFLKDYPNYYVKFASNNPRNPITQANVTEQEILSYFTADQGLKKWQGVVPQQNKPYFVVAKPFRFKEKCMRCHSEPSLAPVTLRQRYGDEHGFQAQVGDVTMYSIGVPIEYTYQDVLAHTATNFAPAFLLTCLVLVFSSYFYKRLVTRPMADLQQGIHTLSKGDYGNQVDETRAGELGEVAQAFNRMASELGDNIQRREQVESELLRYQEKLEQRVEKRTADLQASNDELRQEIARRQEAESQVKVLGGLLPLCSFCKKVRDDEGYWQQVDTYIHKHSEADISHSICPECMKVQYPDLLDDE